MENRDFKKPIDLNVMISKFLNLLNFIILNKVNQKLKFLNFYFKKLQTESVANLSFLFLVFEFFIYENIAVFFQDCFLMSVIFIIGMIGLFHTCKGLRKYKEILKSNKREEFI
ncbi:hypothetical protein CEE22_06875 [Campylobacter coli]|nr:hypothetical protein [Campylobacter coli]